MAAQRRRRAGGAGHPGAARRGAGGDRDPAPVDVILERINRFFGWQAVGRLALRQAPLKRRRCAGAAAGRSRGGGARRRHADRRRRRRACGWRSAGSAPRSSERDRPALQGLGEAARRCHIRDATFAHSRRRSNRSGASRDHTSGIRRRNQRAGDRSPRWRRLAGRSGAGRRAVDRGTDGSRAAARPGRSARTTRRSPSSNTPR